MHSRFRYIYVYMCVCIQLTCTSTSQDSFATVMRLTRRFKAASYTSEEGDKGGAALLQPDTLLQRKLVTQQSVMLKGISSRRARQFLRLPDEFRPKQKDPLLLVSRRAVLSVYSDCVAWGDPEDDDAKATKPLRRVIAYKDLRLARVDQVRDVGLRY